MLRESTLEKLHAMRMATMADEWSKQNENSRHGELSFDERFGLLVDAEFLARDNRKRERRLSEAKLRYPNASVEDIDAPARRGLQKSVLQQLATCEWVEHHHNIIITGPTGVGKSFIGCALVQAACRRGYRALYRRASRLFEEMKLAQAAGEYQKLLARFARIDVLLIDDWGIGRLSESQRRDILEVLEDRYAQRSTLITSQLPVGEWHDHIGDPTLADAVLDRVVHNAQRIQLKGESKRKEKVVK